ncbi:MAG: protein kinase [Kofleriaceae bacterium]
MTELPAAFGKYSLTEKLATGGMAEIYLAKLLGPLGFEKQLVIKQIHPRLSGQRAFVELFVAEAKTLVSLTHGNIVPVYELGVVDDTYFIAMEYLDGPTLQRFTDALTARGEQLPPPLAAWIAAEILGGLDHAHRRGDGVIHRDLSPRNVMLSRDGEVKLVDFGIAVTLGSAGEEDGGAPTGSFPYMSPEQVRREALTAQSDLFSVGVLLWEMLTGARLFARPTPEATLAAVKAHPVPPPSTLAGAAAAPLDDLVARAVARAPEHRWASAAEFRAALLRYLYAQDPAPGARDLAPLIARACPPHARRAPTQGGDDSGPVLAEPGAPSTAVMPRAPRGKPKPRARTVATHVELERALERATPIAGVPALVDAPPAPAPTAPAAPPARGAAARAAPVARASSPPAASLCSARSRSPARCATAVPARPGPSTRRQHPATRSRPRRSTRHRRPTPGRRSTPPRSWWRPRSSTRRRGRRRWSRAPGPTPRAPARRRTPSPRAPGG